MSLFHYAEAWHSLSLCVVWMFMEGRPGGNISPPVKISILPPSAGPPWGEPHGISNSSCSLLWDPILAMAASPALPGCLGIFTWGLGVRPGPRLIQSSHCPGSWVGQSQSRCLVWGMSSLTISISCQADYGGIKYG